MNQNADFYDALAPMFDVMTDWDARLADEGPFLHSQLAAADAKCVLDAACGSGGHALWLAQQGYAVAGTDASPVMIALARQKTAATGPAVTFEVADLTPRPPSLPGKGEDASPPLAGEGPEVGSGAKLDAALCLGNAGVGSGAKLDAALCLGSAGPGSGAKFDAVLCLGNSLPHLLTQAALVAALQGMARRLHAGGLLILQNLNYDLRWQQQPRWFLAQGGELEGQPVLVWRFADYDVPAGRIHFHIALFRQGAQEWTTEVHTTPQRPLFRADLLAALTEAGFTRIQTFGRMALPVEPFEAEKSGDLIVVARRT